MIHGDYQASEYQKEIVKKMEEFRSTQSPEEALRMKKRGRNLILGIFGGIIIFIALIIIVPTLLISIYVEKTTSVPGDPNRFDPISTFQQVQSYAGPDAKFTELEAQFVRPDGTMDLNANYQPGPRVNYQFYHELERPPQNAPPLGAGSKLDNKWYERIRVTISKPWQSFYVSSTGGGVNSRYNYINFGMQRKNDPPTSSTQAAIAPAPTCPFEQLWQQASQQGAPADAVATIHYDHGGYTFTIEGTKIKLIFAFDCTLKNTTN